MVGRSLFDNTINALGVALNFRAMNNDIISSNIANADTPGYKAKKLNFEKQLKVAMNVNGAHTMKSSNDRHFVTSNGGIKDVRGNIFFDPRMNIKNDLNSVDIDSQMANLAENQFMYNAAAQIINKKLALLKYAANDGGM
jgi:flagellar basal-body rod protein FlgB